MLKSYFKTAFRNFYRNGAYSVINVLGLAIGVASFVLVLLYLNYELSYDKWSPGLKSVYRVSMDKDGEIETNTPAPLAALLMNNDPNIEAATMVQNSGDFEVLLTAGDKKIYQKNLMYADSLFLRVLPYKIVEGNAANAMAAPNTILISEEVARKLFGSTDAMGKTITLYGRALMVNAVFAKPDGPSVYNTEAIVRIADNNIHWENFSYQTLLKMKQPVAPDLLDRSLNRVFYNERIKKDSTSLAEYQAKSSRTLLFSERLSAIHNFPVKGASNFKTVSTLMVLATLLLIIGAINFSNLSIAASVRRAREVGVRKVLGSGRWQIVKQFLGEFTLQCLIAFGTGLLLLWPVLSYFKAAFGIGFDLLKATDGAVLGLQLLACFLLVVLISGLYPSFFLSRFSTSKILKGHYSEGAGGNGFRNVLIVLQFVFSAFFVIASLGIKKQMDFMQSKDKGFSGSQVMRIQVLQKTGEEGFENVRNRLLSVPGVEYVAKTTNMPGAPFLDTMSLGFKFEGKEVRLGVVKISSDFFDALQIPLVTGRKFDERPDDQHTRNIILNETAARKLGAGNVIGKLIYFPYEDSLPARIVGVIKDYNVSDYANAVVPLTYSINNEIGPYRWGGGLVLKLKGNDLRSTIRAVEQEWKSIEPENPIRYSFIDDDFQKLFQTYIRTQNVILFFTIVAVVIALVGLFALISFVAKSRAKEISIRKVLGASAARISVMLSLGFLKLVLIGTIVAIPVGWLAISKWLETFVYKASVGWELFLGAALILVMVSLIVLAIQTLRAAASDPVRALRSE
ncbi:ABC transporter permease [Niabella drilacis]|uniref:Putative ABC transport system permease protein n=1 Tax=Niabella drilacis (strain DSM 25811 / CCM 8410 / CCUG 62505 / LMG 26954 / E90) TaxID=1285928 RepID=A0A1G7AL63_NIADE|nr:ABC transporter permease [Niabella drilacis]SDE14626.1 putative ABC transport system permease protein [Niabella drilacis]